MNFGQRFAEKPWLLPFLGGVLIWIMIFENLGGYDLSAPDEPHYGLVAREMLENNHWLLPHRNDKPYPDKPPLFFWSIAAVSFLGGGEVTAASTRLPSALAAVWVLWMLWCFARKPRELDDAPLLSVLTLLGSVLFFYQARMAQIDMLLCCFTTSAAYLGFRLLTGEIDEAQRHKLARYLGLCLGFGILAKGPVGYLVPIGGMALFCALSPRDTWKRFPKRSLLWGLAPPALWIGLLLAEVALSGQWAYLYNMLFKQTLVRFVNPWHHYQPFYYFIKTMALDFLPWFFLLLAAIPWRKADRASLNSRQKFAWSIVLFTLVFFSLSRGKRNLYILPLYPFAAYLVADRIRKLMALARPRPIPSLILPALLLTLLFGAFAFIAAGGIAHLPTRLLAKVPEWVEGSLPQLAFWTVGLVGSLAGIFAIINACRGRARSAYAAVLICMCIMNVFIYQVVQPWISPHRSARQFTEKAMAILDAQPQRPLVSMVLYRSAYRFFGTYPLVELSSEHDEPPGLPKLSAFWSEHPDGFAILRREHLGEFLAAHPQPVNIHLAVFVGRGEEMLLASRAHSSPK